MLEPLKNLLGTSSLTRTAGRALGPALLILGYHDLGRADDPVSWLRVPEDLFAAQLRTLRRHCHLLDPRQVDRPAALARDRLNLVLSFDDGYLNNLRLAEPLLARHEAPAAFFISTDHLQSGQTFWFDRVVTPLQLMGTRQVDLREFGLGTFRLAPGPEERRWVDIGKVLVAIKSLAQRDLAAAKRTVATLGADQQSRVDETLAGYRPLQADELRELAASPWAVIGSHSHRHHYLTAQDPAAATAELRLARTTLEDLLDRECTQVSYPYGDANEAVLTAAGGAGYRLGYTTRWDLATGRSPLLALPRLLVGAFDTPRRLLARINLLLLRRGVLNRCRGLGTPQAG